MILCCRDAGEMGSEFRVRSSKYTASQIFLAKSTAFDSHSLNSTGCPGDTLYVTARQLSAEDQTVDLR